MQIEAAALCTALLLRPVAAYTQTSETVRPVETGAQTTVHKYLVVNVNPSNATVTADEETAMTDEDGYAVFYLPVGTHSYHVSSPGYATQSGTVDLTEKKTVRITLVPLTGILNINYSPVEAEIWIDGAKAGTSPDEFSGMLAGIHKIELRKDGYVTRSENVTVKEGETTMLIGKLDKVEDIQMMTPAVVPTATDNGADDNDTSKQEQYVFAHELPAESSLDAFNSGFYTCVDLGLSVKWATCNIGASCPEEHGSYFTYGEMTPATAFANDDHTVTTDVSSDGGNTTEQNTAHSGGNGTWRLPTKAECDELVKECTWEWTALNGENGYKITGKNGNSIFLPAAGWGDRGITNKTSGKYGYYWSSTPHDDDKLAFDLYFSDREHGTDWVKRQSLRSVRLVRE